MIYILEKKKKKILSLIQNKNLEALRLKQFKMILSIKILSAYSVALLPNNLRLLSGTDLINLRYVASDFCFKKNSHL